MHVTTRVRCMWKLGYSACVNQGTVQVSTRVQCRFPLEHSVNQGTVQVSTRAQFRCRCHLRHGVARVQEEGGTGHVEGRQNTELLSRQLFGTDSTGSTQEYSRVIQSKQKPHNRVQIEGAIQGDNTFISHQIDYWLPTSFFKSGYIVVFHIIF